MKMWEIKESSNKYDSDYRMGMKHKDSKLQEAYDCGFEDGYKKAIEDYEEKMEERSNYRDSEESMGYKRRR